MNTNPAMNKTPQPPQYDNISNDTDTGDWYINGVQVKPGAPNVDLERLQGSEHKSVMLQACLNYWMKPR